MTSWVAGDVLSSGFASLPGESKRDSKDETLGLVKIPSIPLAARDAQKLLEALQGHGYKLHKDWVGGLDLEYWSGDQFSPVVLLMNDQDEEERQPIYNVLGKIIGSEQSEKSVIVGNHRDAWCFGAADPGSGTAILSVIIEAFHITFCEITRFETCLSNTENCFLNRIPSISLSNADLEYYCLG